VETTLSSKSLAGHIANIKIAGYQFDLVFICLPSVDIAIERVRREIIRRFSDISILTAAIQKATRDAILDHKKASNPVADWQNGKVVIVQPEDIALDW
jgi:predicted ABC-type ATPase